ncbi:MAG TPA: serine/threonine-protein kinase [Kofleriaceae bacterium]
MCAASGDAYDHTVVERRDPLIGTVLDKRFRIDSQIAAGGFGAIYRATDVQSDAEIALKILLPQLARDPSVVARFRREGKTLANLRDPHTITAYELGEAPDGTLYIVMELLHGESLYHRYKTRGPLPWRQVIHIARGVCSSLAEAHAAGVVHRDLKPANIHLEDRDGDPDFVKVLDFGIAKIVQGNEYDRTELTQAGTMIGTVDYMSPEQMVGGEMTPASDVYTLGVVLYEMIAGRTPFAGATTATAILASVLTQTPVPLGRHADVPARLERIIARCLEREAKVRYLDVMDLADELAEVAGDSTTHRRPYATPAHRDTRADLRDAADSATIAQSRMSQLVIGDATFDDTAFDQSISTTESTRIDVRRIPPTPSTTPVVPPKYVAVVTPATPIAAPPPKRAKGSQLAIDARAWQPMPDSRGALPAIGQTGQLPAIGAGPPHRPRLPTPPPPMAMPQMPPRAGPHPPPMMPPVHGGLPPAHGGLPPARGGLPPAHGGLPPARGGLPPGLGLTPPPFPAGARAPVRSYDMTADASRDTLVRRIIWIALILAGVLAALIATR